MQLSYGAAVQQQLNRMHSRKHIQAAGFEDTSSQGKQVCQMFWLMQLQRSLNAFHIQLSQVQVAAGQYSWAYSFQSGVSMPALAHCSFSLSCKYPDARSGDRHSDSKQTHAG